MPKMKMYFYSELHLAIIHKFMETVFALVRMVPHPDYLNLRNNDRQVRISSRVNIVIVNNTILFFHKIQEINNQNQ